MGGRSKGPKIPKPVQMAPMEEFKDIIDYVSGQQTVQVIDPATGRKQMVTRALPANQRQNIVPQFNDKEENKLDLVPLMDKLNRITEIVKDPKERKIFIEELQKAQIKPDNEYDNILLGRRLLGQIGNNIDRLIELNPEQAQQMFGPELQAYRRMQTYAMEKNFDFEEAKQEALLAKTGQIDSTSANELRIDRARQRAQQRNELEDRMILAVDQLKANKLAEQLQAQQAAANIEGLGIQQREQDIQAELNQVQQRIAERTQDIQAQTTTQELDLREDANQIAIQDANQKAQLAQNQMDLAVDEQNRNAIVQQNQDRLASRAQDIGYDTTMTNLYMGRNPFQAGLAEFELANNINIARNQAQNTAQFQRSSLQQQRFANARPSGLASFGRAAMGLGGMALGAGFAPAGAALTGALIGGQAGNTAGGMF